MQIHNDTLNILKNFSTINPSILIKTGNIIRTIAPTRSIFAKAVIDQEFEADFAVYDLNNFLSCLSLFSPPNIDIKSDGGFVLISGENKKSGIKYYMTAPENIETPPDKNIVLPSVEVEMTLSENQIKTVIKALDILNVPEIGLIGKDGVLSIQATNSKASGSHYYNEIGESKNDFKFFFKSENIKFIPSDYEVKISQKGLAHFKNNNLEYFVAVEQNSEFH